MRQRERESRVGCHSWKGHSASAAEQIELRSRERGRKESELETGSESCVEYESERESLLLGWANQ